MSLEQNQDRDNVPVYSWLYVPTDMLEKVWAKLKEADIHPHWMTFCSAKRAWAVKVLIGHTDELGTDMPMLQLVPEKDGD